MDTAQVLVIPAVDLEIPGSLVSIPRRVGELSPNPRSGQLSLRGRGAWWRWYQGPGQRWEKGKWTTTNKATGPTWIFLNILKCHVLIILSGLIRSPPFLHPWSKSFSGPITLPVTWMETHSVLTILRLNIQRFIVRLATLCCTSDWVPIRWLGGVKKFPKSVKSDRKQFFGSQS